MSVYCQIMGKDRFVRLAAALGLAAALAACGSAGTPEQLSGAARDAGPETTQSSEPEPASTPDSTTRPTTAAPPSTSPPATAAPSEAKAASEQPWPADDADVITFVDAPQPAPGTRETWRDQHGNLSPYVKRVRYVHDNTDALLAAFRSAVDDGEGQVRLRLFRDLLIEARAVHQGRGSGYEPPPYTTWDEESFYAEIYDNGRWRAPLTLFWSETTRQDGYHSEYLHLGAGNWIEIDLVGDVFGIYELDEDRPSYDD